jgi:hypothetical protein
MGMPLSMGMGSGTTPAALPRPVYCHIAEVTPATCCRPLLFHIETTLPNGVVCEVTRRFKCFKNLHAYISKIGTPWAERLVREISLPSGGFRFTSYRMVLRLERIQALREFLDCLVSDPAALSDPAIADFLGVAVNAATDSSPKASSPKELRSSPDAAVWPGGPPRVSSSREHTSLLSRIESGLQISDNNRSDDKLSDKVR